MTSAPAIAFDVRPARAIVVAATAVLALALLALALCDLPGVARGLLAGVVLAGGVLGLRRYANPPWRHAQGHGGEWTLTDAAGRAVPARLCGHAAFGAAVQLDFAVHGRRWSLLLLPGNSQAETRRRLRLFLAESAPGATREAHPT